MANGGKRPGAGRQKGSIDRAGAARKWATRLWKSQDWDGALQEIRDSDDLGAKSRVVVTLLNYMYGKPVQPVGGPGGEGPVEVRIISNIARPQRVQ